MRSLPLRPGDLLTTPMVALSMGFSSFGFPPGCHPATGVLALPLVGLSPTGRISLSWSHHWVERRSANACAGFVRSNPSFDGVSMMPSYCLGFSLSRACMVVSTLEGQYTATTFKEDQELADDGRRYRKTYRTRSPCPFSHSHCQSRM
jgi:hypothetical protein